MLPASGPGILCGILVMVMELGGIDQSQAAITTGE